MCYQWLMRRYGTPQNYIATYIFGPNQVQQYPSLSAILVFPFRTLLLASKSIDFAGQRAAKRVLSSSILLISQPCVYL